MSMLLQRSSLLLGLPAYSQCCALRVYCIVCSLVVCGSANDLREMSSWDGKGPTSRCKLIHQLQGTVPSDIVSPKKLCIFVSVRTLSDFHEF